MYNSNRINFIINAFEVNVLNNRIETNLQRTITYSTKRYQTTFNGQHGK